MIESMLDVIERATWTLIECAVALMIVLVLGWSLTWIPFIALGLAVIKGFAATMFGMGTASLMDPEFEPVPRSTFDAVADYAVSALYPLGAETDDLPR